MIHQVRIFGATLLMAIYCLAVGAITDYPVHTDHAPLVDHATNVDQNRPVVLNNLYNHFSFYESTFDSQNNSPSRNFENPLVKLWASAQGTEHLLRAVFKQYTFFFGNTPIQLRTTDIIFPFHYFW